MKIMDNKKVIRDTVLSLVEGEGSQWAERGFFVVAVACKGAAEDEIEVSVDSDGETGVGIDDCAVLSREISAKIEAELAERLPDFSLVVMSAGLGQPLRLGRQYQKLIRQAALNDGDGLPRVDVLFKDGRKLTGVVLCGIGYGAADEEEGAMDIPSAIEVAYTVKEQLPGKKRKTDVERRERIELAETKAVSEHFEFK